MCPSSHLLKAFPNISRVFSKKPGPGSTQNRAAGKTASRNFVPSEGLQNNPISQSKAGVLIQQRSQKMADVGSPEPERAGVYRLLAVRSFRRTRQLRFWRWTSVFLRNVFAPPGLDGTNVLELTVNRTRTGPDGPTMILSNFAQNVQTLLFLLIVDVLKCHTVVGGRLRTRGRSCTAHG